MKLEFGKSLPEDLSIPSITGYPQIICEKVHDTLRIESRKVVINSNSKEYIIIAGNDEDKYFTSSAQENTLTLSQHQELDLFVVLIKFAHDQGILKNILSINGANYLAYISEITSGESICTPLHQGLTSMDCIEHPFSINTDQEFTFFNLGRGHHCNKESYKVSIHENQLLFSFKGNIEFIISEEEVIIYLRLLANSGKGIAAQCLYILEYVFSPKDY